MPAPAVIHQLVARFEENRDSYRSGKYNEAQLRQEFLDPFFEALGWDIYNKNDYSPEYRDVVIEDSLEIEGSSKAPDYAFKIGKERKFYVEAKKPTVNIQFDIHPAYQVRRYAWNAHLAISVLTDFEEFAVYNCKDKPNPTDSAATGRDKFFKYTDYVEKWDEIASIFSRDAVWRGSFDRFATTSKGKKGTTEVDDAFLKDIEEWRTLLARNIALRNPLIADERQLNYAVQMTIDRIIFLRICEDRGIEPDEQLKATAKIEGVYPHLVELFRKADTKYNSGLFHFSAEKAESTAADTFTLDLKIDDKVLKEIILSIYYPCPYIFKEIPVEILGQVYEQFLGKVIRLTAGHQAKVEEKPEVRKAGGVYYTPKYIVDYIVQNTVGKLLEDKTPTQAAELKVVDPACGSGSFLLGAYQHLMDWHIQWYIHNEPEKWAKGKKPAVMQASGGGWKLTTQKKKEILVNNIFGVDIDAQAVEVTKLSLLLKVLEEESGQLSLGFERVLPDLGRNIQCGNSLIGEDYFEGQLVVDEEERRRVNPFDWQRAFPQVFARGGFDAVIGNPPYLGGREWKEEDGRRYQYFIDKFQVTEYQFDIYAVFWEQGINILKSNGLIGFITPNTWLNNLSNRKLRKFILDQTSIVNITDYSREHVFNQAVVLPIVSILKKERSITNFVNIFRSENGMINFLHSTRKTLWENDNLNVFNIDLLETDFIIREKIENGAVPLETLAVVKFGIKLYETGKGVPSQPANFSKNHTYESKYQVDETYRKYLEGKDIQRFFINWQSRWLKYGKNLAAPRDPELFHGERILVRRIVGNRLISTFTDEDFVTSQLLQIVKPKNERNAKYYLGLLNSTLLAYYFKKKYNRQDKTFPEIRIYELCTLPIKKIDFLNPEEVKSQDLMVSLVERMLDLHKSTPVTPQEKESVQRQIKATDRQIDQLVYELYGLTEEEIKIVEGE